MIITGEKYIARITEFLARKVMVGLVVRFRQKKTLCKGKIVISVQY